MFEYQQTNHYFAQVADGLEDLARDELAELGAREANTVFRGVHFEADKATLYRVNYESRIASRIIAPLARFPARTPDELYDAAGAIDWSALLSVQTTFAVAANVADSRITHAQYAALRVKDAIVDQFRKRVRARPTVDTDQPDVALHLFIHRNHATLSLDMSGAALHRRGYRQDSREAPLRETLAAAIIRLTEWDGSRPLCDPMCGSGTLLCEALMRYARIPAAFLRKRFGFERMPDFDRALWQSIRRNCDRQIRDVPDGLISGSDKAAKAVEAAGKNLRRLPHGERVVLRITAFEKIAGIENALIVCNPPAGVRIGAAEGMEAFTKSFGDFLKQRCRGSTACIYFTDRALVKHIGLRTAWKKPLRNGALDGRLVRIDLY